MQNRKYVAYDKEDKNALEYDTWTSQIGLCTIYLFIQTPKMQKMSVLSITCNCLSHTGDDC